MQKEFQELFDRIDAMYKAKILPKLKTMLKGTSTNLMNLTNLLVRKSILKENLYNYSDDERDDFFLPEEKVFIEGEKDRVIYDRLKASIYAFDNLSNALPGDAYSVTLKFIENAKKLLSYFAFNNFLSGSASINTRTLKDMCDRILASKDQIIKKVVQDNLKLLSDSYNKLNSMIDEIIRFKKEEYKFHIRYKIFPFLSDKVFTEKILDENPALYIKKASEYMISSGSNIPVYKNWLLDALKSCYAKSDKEEFDRIKAVFLTDEHKKDTKAIIHSPREKLIAIIDKITKTGYIMEKIYLIMEQNIKMGQERDKTIIEKLINVFMKVIQSVNEEDFFQLEYINPATKNIENDTININEFILNIKKKIVLYKSIEDVNSNTREKIKRGSEESLYKFIEDTYFELLLIKERIIGIDAEIKIRVPKKIRPKLKEISDLIEQLDEALRIVGQERRKYVIEQENYFGKTKK
ncbi:MAG: hypothetical protein JXB50_04555 [Spirochaetes bacterium]|nr:hypothetical protein [Spirochaetota bacterium]